MNFPAAPVTRHFAIANLATTFYYISGDPALPTSWRTDAAGTGGTPLASDFTTSGRTFIIPTPRTATLATPLTFGAGVNFTMEAGTTLNGGNQALTLGAGGAVNIAGTIILDGASTLVANATPVVQNGGTLRLVGDMSAVTMNAPLYLSGSTLAYDNRTSAVGAEFPLPPNAMQGNVQIGGTAGASAISFPQSRTITGSLAMQGASQLIIGGTFTNIQLGGALALGSGTIVGAGDSRLTVNGSGAVTGALTAMPPDGIQILNLERAATITLGGNLELENLVLQGRLDARTNNTIVRVTGEGGGALTSFGGAVDGNLERRLPANTAMDGSSFAFPVTHGGSGAARTLTLQNIRTGAVAPLVRVRFDSVGAATVQANGGLSSVQPANWRVEVVSGDFFESAIALNEAAYQTTNRIGVSEMQAGDYARVSSGLLQTTSRQTFKPAHLTRFFAVGVVSTNPARYTLQPGADPTVSANWVDSLGNAAPDFITRNSEFVISAGSPVVLGANWSLGDEVSLVVKAGATLVIPDMRTLSVGSGGMLVEAGTPATMNEGGTVVVQSSGRIIGASATYAGATATLRYEGGGAKTATETELSSNFGGSLTVNRSGILTIPASRSLAGSLRLLGGVVEIPPSATLALTNPQPSALEGGGANAFVLGALQRTLLPNLLGAEDISYAFPIGASAGASGTRFLPFRLLSPRTSASPATVLARSVAESSGGSPQTGLTTLSQTEFWEARLLGGSVSALVEIGGVNFASAKVVATSATQTGVYRSARGSGTPPTLRSAERVGLEISTFFAAADGVLPTVFSVIPLVAAEGESVTINGANLLSVQRLDFAGAETTPLQASAPQIQVRVPPRAQTGALRLITPVGIVTAAELFTVRSTEATVGAPIIASIEPSEAPPGARVTIRGERLNGARVEFRAGSGGSSLVAATIASASTTEIVALVPQNATSGTIVVSTLGGSAISAVVFPVLPPANGAPPPSDSNAGTQPQAPVVTEFSPAVADSGEVVIIRGRHLVSTGGSTTVLFGGVPAVIVSANDSTLAARVPTNGSSGLITVQTPAGVGASQTPFTTRQDSLRNALGEAPQITGIEPPAARVGDTLRILGRNFSLVSAVAIGSGSPTALRLVSPQEIRVRIPPDASSGAVSLTYPAGVVNSPSSLAFTLLPPQIARLAPVISSFSRDTVRVGDTLIVRGVNLTNLTRIRFLHSDLFVMDAREVISSSATALALIVPQPPDTAVMRLFSLFLLNDVGATTSNFGLQALWIIPTRLTPRIVDAAREQDSLALLGFFEATGGRAVWRKSDGWGTNQDISSWFGVTLENNRVTRLSLPNNNLRARGLPADVERLNALRALDLSGNALGNIAGGNASGNTGDAAGLGRLLALENLEELRLADCDFVVRLEAIALGGAQQRGLCNLTKLRVLNLAGNRLTGSLPVCLGNLSELRALDLSRNTLSGELPRDFVRGTLAAATTITTATGGGAEAATPKITPRLAALGNLQSLNLADNWFLGFVPREMSALISLRALRLSRNGFKALPDFSGLRLDTVAVDGNALTFADLEQFTQNPAPRSFEYAPQDSVGETMIILAAQGDSLTIRAAGATGIARVEWFKNGVLVQAGASAEASVLRIASLRLSDAGAYSYRVAHPALPALALVSRRITLQVQAPATPQDSLREGVALSPPIPLFPQRNSRNIARRPTLKWSRVLNALGYEVELRAAAEPLTAPPIERVVTEGDTARRVNTTLPPESRFQWRARAVVTRAGSLLRDRPTGRKASFSRLRRLISRLRRARWILIKS